jgi:hypothetical protein
VFLEPTKADKLTRIATLGCTHFIDDLPEFLSDPGFPPAWSACSSPPPGRAPADPV